MLESLIKKKAVTDFSFSERLKIIDITYTFKNIQKEGEFQYFNDIMSAIAERDCLTISLIDEAENRIKNFNKEEYEEFRESLNNDDKVTVNIEVEKEIKDDVFSIYNFENFITNLVEENIDNAFKFLSDLFSKRSSKNKKIVFEIQDETLEMLISTKTMIFTNNKSLEESQKNIMFDRSSRIETCKDIAKFYSLENYELLPEDFKLESNCENIDLDLWLKKTEEIFSVSLIATSANLDSKKKIINLSIKGANDYSWNIDELNYNKYFFYVYNWVYTDGNPVDKILIARNILTYFELDKLNKSVIDSIQSNYKLYLKNNVTQYIELKKKLAEFIGETVSKMHEIMFALLNKYVVNLVAVLSFIITVILSNIASDQKVDNILTDDVKKILLFILIGSFVYLLMSFIQNLCAIQHINKSYQLIKENYATTLSEIDLVEAFNNDSEIKEITKNAVILSCLFAIIWLISIIVCVIVIVK